jgi:hypothetical protein
MMRGPVTLLLLQQNCINITSLLHRK